MRAAVRSSVLAASAAIGFIGLTAAAGFDGTSGLSAVHADSAAVANVINNFHKSLSSADSAGAMAALAGDAIILESGGVESRAEYRSHHLSGDISFAKAVRSERGPLSVTIEGNTAWTAVTSTTQGEFSGRQITSVGAESMVLTRSNGVWKIRSIHWSSRNRRPAP